MRCAKLLTITKKTMHEETTTTYTVTDVVTRNHDTTTLKLTFPHGQIPEFHSGQFITVYFPESHATEGKSYTISSPPNNTTLDITVKNIGVFSNKLSSLNTGDKILASLPYGYFYSEESTTHLCMIAGGIGITPFMGMVPSILKNNPERSVTLFWTVKYLQDIFMYQEFELLKKKYKNFHTHYFITKDTKIPSLYNKGRITMSNIEHVLSKKVSTEFLLCGSIEFVRDFWKLLIKHNISRDVIYTEAFF